MDQQLNRSVQIGNICIQWSNLEYELALSIWLMLRIHDDLGKIVTASLDCKQRASMAFTLAHKTKAPYEFKQAQKEVLKEIRDGLLERRNEAVHAVHFKPYAFDTAKVEMHRGKGGREPRPLLDADLAELGQLIFKAGLRAAEANVLYASEIVKTSDVEFEPEETALSILRKISPMR
ncbi:hypothetical protein [Alteraurantiacibacter buctensis]|uniref:Uncharacterized protein n=1 Tax=Alteraurantiacibacter buctensis TaxID=1503981 RepID=A0A844Z232_9SPHN|nr:hypothetical protein [Alteraurantiacibacter buctensis]MXO73582.1 hypothetical protein [Alteraurantiacibacter buctensis]